MQMIDVLKRLAELDASNPNIVKESMTPKDMEECGDDMMANEPSQSNGPVSVNISANSGEELGDMLSAIMQLAGVHKVGDEHMGVEPPASVLTAEPNMHKDAHGVDDMRAVLDQMNGASGEEETDESAASDETHPYGIPGVDTTPADPHKQLPFNPNEFAQNTNDGDGDRANGHPRLTTQPTATYENLMAEYKTFISESTQEVGQMMANDGITYSPEHEGEIIGKMAEYMKSAGMNSKQIRYLLSYDEDYIADQLSYLPRVKNQGILQGSGKIGK
jgi:hypothetical protein